MCNNPDDSQDIYALWKLDKNNKYKLSNSVYPKVCLEKEIKRWMDYKETLGKEKGYCDGKVCCLDCGDHFIVYTYVESTNCIVIVCNIA